MDKEKKTPFSVSDKRFLDEEGTLKKEQDEKVFSKKEDTQEQKKATSYSQQTPELNFSAFVFSLSTSALIYLGEMPNPVTNKKEEDFDLAKQNIDILSILAEKTKGNLDQNEERLLASLLYDLRMKYVEKVKK